MAYEYKKLSEVTAIDAVDSAVNLLVEQNDEIKKVNVDKLPIPTQTQADWNEEDETSPAFIKNKPDLSQVGGSGSGGEVIIINTDYNFDNIDWHYADGTVITPESLKNKLEAGAVVYFARYQTGLGDGYRGASVFYRVNEFYYLPSYTNMSGFYEKSFIKLSLASSEYVSTLSKWMCVCKDIYCYGE